MDRTIRLRNQIGIDKVVFKITPIGIPFTMSPKLEARLHEENVYYELSGKDNLFIAEDSRGKLYKRLIVHLSDYEKATITVNRKSLLVKVELERIPIQNHESLGNIENATYETVTQQLNKVLNCLESEYDIRLSRNDVFLKEIEINRTFVFPYKFELCSQFFMYLLQSDSYYTSITYNKEEDNPNSMSKVAGNTTKVARKNRETVIYNKKLETIEWQNKFNNRLSIKEDIVRIEFRASRNDVISRWFDGTTDWSKLNQDKIEKTYQRCCKEYLFKPFEQVKKYRKNALDDFITSYNSSQKFKLNLIRFFVQFEKRYKYPITLYADEFECRDSIKANSIMNPRCKKTKVFCDYYKEVINEWTQHEDEKTHTTITLEDVKNYIFGILKNNITPQTEVNYKLYNSTKNVELTTRKHGLNKVS